MQPLPYYLGLPLWSNTHWKGSLFGADAKPADFLAQYAQVFNAVEGNTTFYAVPSAEMVSRWLAMTPDSRGERDAGILASSVTTGAADGWADGAIARDVFAQRVVDAGKFPA